MNGEHFRAFLWLRWRLRVNQFKRAGTANAVILAILAGLAVILGILAFLIFLLVGAFGLRDVSAPVIMYVWDGLIAALLFCWAIGLLAELQRSEVLTLDKFLHLPVSLAGVFLINYLSSLFSMTLLVFVPGMLGLIIGLVIARGPAMLLQVPLAAAFLLMVTALTYQFQGWLASLMVNKRRRRTVIVVVTMAFVLVFQLPNLLNIIRPWKNTANQIDELEALRQAEKEEIRQAESLAGTAAERTKRREEIEKAYGPRLSAQGKLNEETKRHELEQLQHTLRIINFVAPPGWLALGAMAAFQGEMLPALLGTLGLGLIGTASLWRSYTTIVRLYTGQVTSARRKAAPAAVPRSDAGPPRLLEKQLPWMSEHAAAIALASFRSLLRAPEAKLMLLSPVFIVIALVGLFFSKRDLIPEAYRPLVGFVVTALILMTMIQLLGNQFGFDRNGFRVYVLCGARRSDILLGKNLAVAPFALGMVLLLVVILQVMSPSRLDHFLAIFPLATSMFLVFCLLANLLSIIAPVPIASGSLKPRNVKGIPLLLHFSFVLVFPPAMSVLLLPYGVEAALERAGWGHGLPIYLVLALSECVAIVFLYRAALTWEGLLLQAREQKILDVVTARTE